MRQRKTPYDVEDPVFDGMINREDLYAEYNSQNITMNELLIKYNSLKQYNQELERKLYTLNTSYPSHLSTINSSTSSTITTTNPTTIISSFFSYFLPSSSSSSINSTPLNHNNSINDNDDENLKYKKKSHSNNYYQIIYDRGSWLIGLLILQSFSSIILSKYEQLLQQHPVLIYFLTMLIGAGGNAGSQATVRMIREIALGNVTSTNKLNYIYRELTIAGALSILVGITGFIRAILSSKTNISEVIAVTIALMVIVIISILLGTILPLILDMLKIDPAHSSTSIQVIMDILGVLLVCSVASLLL